MHYALKRLLGGTAWPRWSATAARQPSLRPDASRVLLFPALAFWTVAKSWLAWGRHFNQDEFDTVHQAWLVFCGKVQFVDFNSNHPPLIYDLLALLYHLSEDAVTVLLASRVLTALSAALVLLLLYQITRAVYGATAARWTVIVYAVNATVLEVSTEVRTELLLVPLWLAAIWLLLSPARITPRLRLIAVGLLLGAAFWTNQKFVLHCVPLGLFLLAGGPRRQWRARDVGIALAASLVPTAVVLARAAWQGSLEGMLRHNFLGAWTSTTAAPYEHFRSFTISSALARDPGFALLAAAALAWTLCRARRGATRGQLFVVNPPKPKARRTGKPKDPQGRAYTAALERAKARKAPPAKRFKKKK